MKRLFLLIAVCMIGMVLPQGMLADVVTYTYPNLTITIDGGTVTINSAKAGALDKTIKPNEMADLIDAISKAKDKIVFVGKFNEQDLKKLQKTDGPEQDRYNCCTQKTVDMAEAKFVKDAAPGQNKYKLYNDKNDLPATSENNKKYLAGGTLWKSKEVKTWVPTNETPPNNNYQNSDGWTVDNINTVYANYYDDQPNPIVRIANEAHYYQLIDNSVWETDEPNYGNVKDASYLNGPGSYDGEQIRVIDHYNYYKLVVGENNTRSWQVASENDGEFLISEVDDSYKDNTLSQYGENNLVAFPTYNYFKFHASRTWQSVNEADIPAGTHVEEPNWNENDRQNHTDGNLLSYIRFVISYVNYKKERTGFTWVQEEYSNGTEKDIEYRFANEGLMPTPTENNKYAYVGGDEYTFDGTNWVVASEGTEEYDYTKMKFDYWKDSVEEIITSEYATGPLAEQLCTDCTKLKTLTLSAGDFALGNTVLGNNINSLKTVNIKEDVTTLSPGMFNGIGTLSTVDFEDGCQIKTLPTGVFRSTGITEVEIPSSVELIEPEAFHSCASLETVTFVNTNTNPLIIKNRAFQNSQNIKDVFVEVKFSERHMICEYNAFDFKSMQGQTQENAPMTTLHFPEDDNSFNYYAGEWKKGMSMRQSDLNAFKDGLNVTYNEQEYIAAPTQSVGEWYSEVDNSSDGYYHPSDASKKYAPANGWQQFAKTDSKREVFVKGNIYMTYSTDKAYSLPTGIIAFRVTDYKEAEEVNGKTRKGRLVLKKIDQVPTETGMLLISTDKYIVKNEDVMTVFFFNDAKGTPDKYHYTMGAAGDATSNYLAPAVHGITVGPVSQGKPKAETGEINVDGRPFTHRNFILRKSDHRFVRTTKGTMPDNRAFLSLPKKLFTNDNETADEGPNPWNTKAGDAFSTYDETSTEPGSNAKTNLFFEYDVEEYGMIWPLIKDEGPSGITTGIKNMNVETVPEGIYTLQGVKVSAPSTKGIYIVNGKKVIIK